jgi:uncharacterized membrane protein
MPTIEESITIDRPASEVYAFMSDASNVAVYDSSCIRSESATDGELAVGSRWRGATKVLGREFEWVTECTQLEPEKSATFKSVEGKLPFEITTQYTPDGEGTRLNYRLEAESGLGGVFGRFADPLVVKAQTRTVKANLVTLKELLESQAE